MRGQNGQKKPTSNSRALRTICPSASPAARAPDPVPAAPPAAPSPPPSHPPPAASESGARGPSQAPSCCSQGLEEARLPETRASPTCAQDPLNRRQKINRGEGSKRSRYPFFLLVRKARERGGAGPTQSGYLTGRPRRSAAAGDAVRPRRWQHREPPGAPGTEAGAPEVMGSGGWGPG